MTDHADLSRRLALAIGWPKRNIIVTQGYCFIWRGRDGRGFDYRDPAVIWPIAERYDCFPMRSAWSGKWGASLDVDLFDLGDIDYDIDCDTAAEAVARAVIGAHE